MSSSSNDGEQKKVSARDAAKAQLQKWITQTIERVQELHEKAETSEMTHEGAQALSFKGIALAVRLMDRLIEIEMEEGGISDETQEILRALRQGPEIVEALPAPTEQQEEA